MRSFQNVRQTADSLTHPKTAHRQNKKSFCARRWIYDRLIALLSIYCFEIRQLN